MQERRATPRPSPDRRETPWSGPRERRAAARPGALRVGDVHVEALDLHAQRIQRGEWSDLAARAIEPNPFLEPEFIIPAAQRLLAAQRPLIVVARMRIEGRMRMIGLAPLAPARQLFGVAPARGWRNPYMPLGAPLLDRDHAVEAFAALLAWTRAFRPHARGLLVHAVPTAGGAVAAMRCVAAAGAFGYRELEAGERAVIFSGADPVDALSADRRRRYGRLRRRLADKGALSFRMPDGVAAGPAMEQFFALEASGWKGARGTALSSDPLSLGFARAFLRGMARLDRACFALLELDGAPIAAGVAIIAGDRAFYWKTAYDERHAAFSPGVQVSIELTAALLARAPIAMIDSCAGPDSPLLGTLWRGRMDVADILVGFRGGFGFAVGARYEILRRSFRAGAKAAFASATGRKPR